MLEFTKLLMVTGVEQRTNKEGNKTYTIVHILGDNGQTVSPMYTGDTNKVFKLEKMKSYEFTFSLTIGQYTRLNIIDIEV